MSQILMWLEQNPIIHDAKAVNPFAGKHPDEFIQE